MGSMNRAESVRWENPGLAQAAHGVVANDGAREIARLALGERVCFAGGPRTGKTTLATELARAMGLDAQHTDSLIDTHDWSEASAAVSTWLDVAGRLVIEGVAVPRALRKWLARNPEGKPCDTVVWMGKPLVALTKGQVAMAKGCATVWAEILPELVKRGVTIEVAS